VLSVIRNDVLQAAGPLQLCAGQPVGYEAAIHAMRAVFDSPDAETVLQVDPSNAFICLNWRAALRIIFVLCPSFAKILTNTYRENSKLYIDGSYILSQEDTTRGDPLAMPMYALGIVPLIQQLTDCEVSQVWYADGASVGGSLQGLRSWWDCMLRSGPEFGYYPNATKTCLIVKSQHLCKARALFQRTGVVITDDGKRHQGSALVQMNF